MTSIDPVTLAALVGTWVLVVGTLAFAYWQLRQTQRLHSASTLLDLRERFFGPRMRQARRELSTWLLKPDRGDGMENWEASVFFELLGSLTHSGALNRRMVWNAFGTWISAYYVFLTEPTDMIASWRAESNDPLIFAEFEWLAKQMMMMDSGAVGGKGPSRTTLEEVRFILENESRLSSAPADQGKSLDGD